MLVVVIGNYMSTNLGDDMYLHLLRARYPQHEFIAHSLLGNRGANFIIYGGGGILNQKSTRRTLLHEWVAKYRVSYCVLSVGAGTVDLKYEKCPFPKAEFITVRDEIALEAIPGSILVPDLSWTFKPPKMKSEIKSETINNSTGIMLRISPRFDSFALVERIRTEMAKLDESWYRFFSPYGVRLGDKTLANVTRAGFPSTYDVYSGSNPAEYLEHYRSCHRVFAMPLHGIIFAAIYGVPWATLSYSPKVDWLIRDLNAIVPATLQDNLTWNETPKKVVRALREEAQQHFSLLDPYLK